MKLPSCMHVLERGWLSSNNILFLGDDENVIIDTGYVTHAEQTLQLVQHVLGDRPLQQSPPSMGPLTSFAHVSIA